MKISKNSTILRELLKQKSKEDIREKDFSGINFYYMDFSGSNFRCADFKNADFSGANFRCAYFENSVFSGANFSDSNFKWVDFENTNFKNAVFCTANFENVDFKNADFLDSNFDNINLLNANFTNINLSNVRLSENDFIKSYKVVSGLYKYPVIFIITNKGHKLVRLGCFIRTMEEWENDFWNNEREFKNDYSDKSEDRLFAFEVAKLWFKNINNRKIKNYNYEN